MTAEASTQDLLPAELTMGTVMLKVGDMKLMTDYYQRALGLDVVAEQDGGLYLGRRRKPLVHLAPAPGLNIPARGEAGLFHTALLFDDQPSLAATVASAARFEPQSFTGSADHLVSEAFYFTDPEGNGIELYWDRPRDAWSWEGKNVVMDSLALPPQRYLEQHLSEESVAGQREAQAGVGHVHLQVGDVQSAHDFYVGHPRLREDSGLARPGAVRRRRRLPPPHGHERLEQPRRWPPPGHPGPRRGADRSTGRRRRRSPRRPPQDRRSPGAPYRSRTALRGPVAQPDPRGRPLTARRPHAGFGRRSGAALG